MATNVTVLNTVWENASNEYQSRIPQATQDNILEVGNAILDYTVAKNEFLDALVNRISLVLVSSKMAKNKLAKFKKGMIEYGSDIEEIFTEMAQATAFDVAKAETEVFKRAKPDVKALFHRVNRENKYKVTIEEAQIKRAFTASDGLGKLVASIINSMYSGDQYDEYVLMKQLVADYFQDEKATGNNEYQFIEVPKVVDQTTAQDFFRTVKQTSTDFTFVSNKFNAKGVKQFTEKKDQVLLLHKNVDTYLNVDVLSYVFNQKNIDFDTQVVVVDDFGTRPNTMGALVDKDWFMVFDKLFQTTSQYNAEGLYWNYWLHHHQLLSTSQFHNAVVFTIPETAS